jgi:hypothetical protein
VREPEVGMLAACLASVAFLRSFRARVAVRPCRRPLVCIPFGRLREPNSDSFGSSCRSTTAPVAPLMISIACPVTKAASRAVCRAPTRVSRFKSADRPVGAITQMTNIRRDLPVLDVGALAQVGTEWDSRAAERPNSRSRARPDRDYGPFVSFRTTRGGAPAHHPRRQRNIDGNRRRQHACPDGPGRRPGTPWPSRDSPRDALTVAWQAARVPGPASSSWS